MRNRKWLVVLVVLGFVVLAVIGLVAYNTLLKKEDASLHDIKYDDLLKEDAPLKGLKIVAVSINIDPILEKAGLNKDTIQSDVELKLRLAGIKVIPLKEVLRDIPGKPVIMLNIKENKNLEIEEAICARCLIDLYEVVYQERKLKKGKTDRIYAIIWRQFYPLVVAKKIRLKWIFEIT